MGHTHLGRLLASFRDQVTLASESWILPAPAASPGARDNRATPRYATGVAESSRGQRAVDERTEADRHVGLPVQNVRQPVAEGQINQDYANSMIITATGTAPVSALPSALASDDTRPMESEKRASRRYRGK